MKTQAQSDLIVKALKDVLQDLPENDPCFVSARILISRAIEELQK